MIHNLRHLSLEQIQELFKTMGEPAFRAKQVWEWIWQKHAASFADMTNLPKALRDKLGEQFSFPSLSVDTIQTSTDGTIKSRFRTHDGHTYTNRVQNDGLCFFTDRLQPELQILRNRLYR
jgi:23S rRNA (adenine2503-C2)-methyltransferase